LFPTAANKAPTLVCTETLIRVDGAMESPTSGANMADIAIRFWDLTALSRDQKKLFPHFGEAGTAVFAIEEVEYGGHDRTSSFDQHHAIISLGGQG
jgi:hypothetical protein